MEDKNEPAFGAWQPIETAPKDSDYMNHHILLCSVNTKAWLGGWDRARKCWTRFNCFDTGFKPTHWMPLPNPPLKEIEGV